MAITLNGTTGITSPALDSEGNLEYSGTLTGSTGVAGQLATFQGAGSASGFATGVVGGDNTFELTSADAAGDQSTKILLRGGNDSSDIEFYKGARGSETQNMILKGDGNLGIGTSGPTEKLHVNGKIVVTKGTHWAGTASQNSTSSPFQFGSNANGEFLRFADGTQIAWGFASRSLSINTSMLGGFRSGGGAYVYSYPIGFAATPRSYVTPLDVSSFSVTSRGGTSTQGDILVLSVSSQGAGNRNIYYLAVGRWY